MSTRTKRSLLILAALVLLAQILLLPRLVRWIDGRVEPKFAEAAKLDAQYREMTNAFPIASEMMPGHPTQVLWEERRTALLAAGYLETRELSLKQKPDTKNWHTDFRQAFSKRFPGTELTTQLKDGVAKLIITARVTDFRAIERFVENYRSSN